MTVIEKPEQRWYSVEEGLPTTFLYVQICIGNWVGFGFRKEWNTWCMLPSKEEIIPKITHWRPRAKPPKQTRPDCKHHRYAYDKGTVEYCELTHTGPCTYHFCEYGADWCKYEAKKTTQPDCKHYQTAWGICLLRPFGDPRGCEYGADWCRYEAKQPDVEKNVYDLHERVSELARLLECLHRRVIELEKKAKDGD